MILTWLNHNTFLDVEVRNKAENDIILDRFAGVECICTLSFFYRRIRGLLPRKASLALAKFQ